MTNPNRPHIRVFRAHDLLPTHTKRVVVSTVHGTHAIAQMSEPCAANMQGRVPATHALTNTFYVKQDGYEYWYTRSTDTVPGRLRLRMPEEALVKFRESRYGSVIEDVVDILQSTNGWWEVTSQDLSGLEQERGIKCDGLKLWLSIFNNYHLGHIVAMPDMLPRVRYNRGAQRQQTPTPAQPATQDKLQELLLAYRK